MERTNPMMPQIEVSFDVYKALMNLREDESVSFDDVQRRLLNLPPRKGGAAESSNTNAGKLWIFTRKGSTATLKHGTELMAQYKGKRFTAKIEGGQWIQDGTVMPSPSAAACAVHGRVSDNGWTFWSARQPGDKEFQKLDTFRKSPSAKK
jgi:predicted CopG family antitoxin